MNDIEKMAAGMIEALKTALQKTDISTDGPLMEHWDSIRRAVVMYPGASLPRDMFECLMDEIHEVAKDALAQAPALLAAIREMKAQLARYQQEPPPEVVEHVAIALSQWRNDKDWKFAQWDSLGENVKKAYRDQAKAALTAYRAEMEKENG